MQDISGVFSHAAGPALVWNDIPAVAIYTLGLHGRQH